MIINNHGVIGLKTVRQNKLILKNNISFKSTEIQKDTFKNSQKEEEFKDFKKRYLEELAAYKHDEEKIEFLNSQTGFIPGAPWDTLKNSKYDQPKIHTLNVDEIIETLEGMNLNISRINILLAPQYLVRPEKSPIGTNFRPSGYLISTETRIKRRFEITSFSKEDDAYKEYKIRLSNLLSEIIKDKYIPHELAKMLLERYGCFMDASDRQINMLSQNLCDYDDDFLKHGELFTDDKGNVDWNIFSSSTSSSMLDALKRLENDDSISDEKKFQITSAKQNYAPFIKRIEIASACQNDKERKKHIDIIKAIINATPERFRYFLLNYSIKGSYFKKGSKVISAASQAKSNDVLIALIQSVNSYYDKNFILARHPEIIRQRDLLEKLLNDTPDLDTKLAILCSDVELEINTEKEDKSDSLSKKQSSFVFDPAFQLRKNDTNTYYTYSKNAAFFMHTNFCLEKLDELESQAIKEDDNETIEKIAITRKALYERWHIIHSLTSYKSLMALINHAQNDSEKLKIIENFANTEANYYREIRESRFGYNPKETENQENIQKDIKTVPTDTMDVSFDNPKYIQNIIDIYLDLLTKSNNSNNLCLEGNNTYSKLLASLTIAKERPESEKNPNRHKLKTREAMEKLGFYSNLSRSDY